MTATNTTSHNLKDIDNDRIRRWSIAAAIEGVSRSRFIAAAADERAQAVLDGYDPATLTPRTCEGSTR